VEDLVGYAVGEPLEIQLREHLLSNGERFTLRRYQLEAAETFYALGGSRGGSGVIVLPCGAGKTVVGLAVMSMVGSETLIVVTNTVAVRQWISEIVDKTPVPREAIGEYTGEVKQVRGITVTTFQCLTYRPSRHSDFPHLKVFNAKDWGLIVYDEVHLLPAPIFRITAEIQAKRRLGLTATLVREDGGEDDVFSLIGPKKYDVPWKELEKQGWIAPAVCREIRMNTPRARRPPSRSPSSPRTRPFR